MRLTEIAKQMKLEAYNTGASTRTLGRGLILTLTPHRESWKLVMEREGVTPSKQEYKIVSKAFFGNRVKRIRKASEFAFELTPEDLL